MNIKHWLRTGEGAKRIFAFLDENPTEPTDGIEDIGIARAGSV